MHAYHLMWCKGHKVLCAGRVQVLSLHGTGFQLLNEKTTGNTYKSASMITQDKCFRQFPFRLDDKVLQDYCGHQNNYCNFHVSQTCWSL